MLTSHECTKRATAMLSRVNSAEIAFHRSVLRLRLMIWTAPPKADAVVDAVVDVPETSVPEETSVRRVQVELPTRVHSRSA